MKKVLIADDHAIVREGVKNIIREMPDISNIDEASEGPEAYEMITKRDYDLVILDISLPGMSGLDILNKLENSGQATRVLMLSFHPQEHYAMRAFRMGASGYVVKDSGMAAIREAIQKVIGGGKYVSPELAEKLVFHQQEKTGRLSHEHLSQREFLVMTKLAAGLSLSEIAAKEFISDKTVSTYRGRILKKMNMKTNADLTRYALENGLIE